MLLTNSTLQNSNDNAWIGLRFTNVTIPNGATINTATLTGEMIGTTRDDPSFNIHCEAADNAGTFTSTNGDISGRTLTTANATITATNVGAGPYAFPDIASVVDEVTSRVGWSSGNALVVILDGQAGGDSEFDSYDGAPSTAFKLDIDYTAAGGLSIPVAYHHRNRN